MTIQELEIVEEQGAGIELVQALPDNMQALANRSASSVCIQGDYFQLLFLEFRGKGFSAWYNQYWTQRATVLRARGNLAMLELRIGMTSQLQGTWETIVQPSLQPGQFNLSFTPHVETRAVFEKDAHCSTFDIHVEPSLLEEIGIDYPALRTFVKQVAQQQPSELAAYPHACPAAMQDAVQFILRNQYSPRAQQQFLEWNIKQIILLALETVASPEHPLPIVLSARDIDGLHAVKAYIADQFPDWPDLATLCRKGELNEFKLKMGFKFLFHLTAYDYHMQLKFQEAKQLLLEGKETISGVAYRVGYDHASSFAGEFKKQFGYTPSWFKKHGRL